MPMFIGGLTTIAVGIFCFTDSEIAWRLYELDCEFWGQSVDKPTDWLAWVHTAGISLILLGIMAVLVGIQMV